MYINPISFGKTYISKTDAIDKKTGNRETLDFVEYDDFIEDELDIQIAKEKWGKYNAANADGRSCFRLEFASDIYDDFIEHDAYPNKHYYGLEDKNGEIQALAEIREGQKTYKVFDSYKNKTNPLEIVLFAVNPVNKHKSKDQKLSKLGTSFFKEIIKMAKRKKSNYISLKDASHGFWDSMPCVEKYQYGEHLDTHILRGSKFDKCIKKLEDRIC